MHCSASNEGRVHRRPFSHGGAFFPGFHRTLIDMSSSRMKMPATPSSSFSPTPPLSSSSSNYSKHPDAPPSFKKRKLNNFQSISSITPTSSPDPQLDAARRAASNRILNVWSSLEQKYACRLDEDDIVDLRTGSIIKDRGVLSSSSCVFDFGHFSEHDTKTGDIDNEGTENEEDEFGGWGSDLELDQQFSQVCQPVRMGLDPADADDLEEFLAAEKSRRQGPRAQVSRREGEKEEWDGSNSEKEAEGDGEDEEGEAEGEAEEEGGREDKSLGLEGSGLSDSDGEQDPVVVQDIGIRNPSIISSDESDDELAGYDATVGEGAMLWEVERSPGHSHSEHSKSEPDPSELPLSKPLSAESLIQTPARSRYFTSKSPLLTPSRTSTSLSPIFRTPRSLSRHETDTATTTLTPITQRLSLKGKETRAVSVSPTKKLVPEVLLPKLKLSPLRLNIGKETSNASSSGITKVLRANSPEKDSLKRKHSFVSDSMESQPHTDPHIQKPLILRKEKQQYFDKKSTSDAVRLGSSADRSQDSPKFTPSLPTEDRTLSSHLPVSSQENKPQLSSTESPSTQCIPSPPYAFPSMPSYSPYASPDWNMHYRQNQIQPPIYSADPRFYLAQAMHSLSFLFNPAQVGNAQFPWPFPLSPPSVDMSHTLPTPSLPVPYSVSSDPKIPNIPNCLPTGGSPTQSPFQKPCLKKVSFSSTPTYSSPSKPDSPGKPRLGQSGSISRSRKGPPTNHDPIKESK